MPATLQGPRDAAVSSGHIQLVAMIAVDHLRQAIPYDDCERLETAPRSHVFHLFSRLVGSVSHRGNKLLDAVKSRPTMFENPTFESFSKARKPKRQSTADIGRRPNWARELLIWPGDW